jgi:predicted transcriptional regulator
MAQAEHAILRCLKEEAKQTSDLQLNNIANISPERLLHEMSSRQKLIRKNGELWNITELGQSFLKNSERSA